MFNRKDSVMTSPRFKEFMHLDPTGFEVVFEEVTILPFRDKDAWRQSIEANIEQFGAGCIWRGSMYWSAELGQCGAITLFVSDDEVYIERLYVDEFLRKEPRQMWGFSYYLLCEVKKRWPEQRITFHDDIYSRNIWDAVAQHGVIKKIGVCEARTYYEVVGDYV